MSQHEFVGFLEAINTDPELSRRVEGIQADTMDEKVRQLIEVGRHAGFTFTEAEMDGLVMAHLASESGEELSAEALDAVAGGMTSTADLPDIGGEMTNLSSSLNQQFLALQQNMQQQSQQYTMISSIMKTKQDTAKATINNLR